MKVIPLQSGSKGNCFYVESADRKILVDAGISIRQSMLRLQSHDRDIHEISDLFITHDHSDHCRYVSEFSQRLDIPVHLTAKTLNALDRNPRVKPIKNTKCFQAGETIIVGDISVHSIPTPHDAADGVVYVLENADHRVGILTDLGHAFAGLKDVLRSLDAVIIESNYDEALLNAGPYPDFLKRRIRGDGGHLSNQDAARLIHKYGTTKMQWVCLCHLSDENNCPETAIRVHQNWLGDEYPLYVADRHNVSKMLELR